MIGSLVVLFWKNCAPILSSGWKIVLATACTILPAMTISECHFPQIACLVSLLHMQIGVISSHHNIKGTPKNVKHLITLALKIIAKSNLLNYRCGAHKFGIIVLYRISAWSKFSMKGLKLFCW